MLLSRLGVLKVYGLVLDMIQSVSNECWLDFLGLVLNNIVEPPAIRRVLHLKMVTQCAMLEDFGIFLVLADKVFFFFPQSIIYAKHGSEGTLRVSY